MNKDDIERISDYFDVPWLVELLGVTIEEIIEAFEDLVEEKLPELNEIMGIDDVRN